MFPKRGVLEIIEIGEGIILMVSKLLNLFLNKKYTKITMSKGSRVYN